MTGQAPAAHGSLDAYWSVAAESLVVALASSPQGLSAAQAAARLTQYGANAVEQRERRAAFKLLARQFANPLVLILVFAAAVSLVLRDWVEAAIILVIVLGSCLLGFSQEYRASAAVAQLRQRLALTVRVRRAGAFTRVDTTTIVPGDIVELAAGSLIPADGVIVEAKDFLVSEAVLTGESFPIEKQPGVIAAEASLTARTNCVFQGTSVRSGTATVLVVKTGRATALGSLVASLAQAAPETDFARGVRHFGYMLLRAMLVIVLFVLVVNQWLGRSPLESLLFAAALAVGLSPELLPAIVSVTLSHGARAMARRGVIVRRLEAIENLGSINVFCTDKTGTLTAGVITLDSAVDVHGALSQRVGRLGYLNAAFETGIDNPLDDAIIAAGERAGQKTAGHMKIDEIPYDFIRKRLTIVTADDVTPTQHMIVTKGAFAQVLSVCSSLRHGETEVPLDSATRGELDDYFQRQSVQGFRVIAVASKSVSPRPRYGHNDEAGMCFEGFLLFFDPPKPGAQETIRELAALGIRIKIITGDNRHVAAHVAAAIGLDAQALLTGEQIAQLRDESLWHLAHRADLFVEVDPQQKERIVRALQHSGNVVGYLGDGINDAPALKAADVGISVDKAVDVARESADVILLKSDLDVLRRGVQEGRRTFANTLKYICITTSANFGNMVSMALVTPLLPFLPLAAKQILLNNFLSDVPSIAIATDRVDARQIDKPQHWDMKQIQYFMVVFGLVSTVFDLLTFYVLLKIFHSDETQFQTAWFVVSLLTELAVVLVLRTRVFCLRSMPSAVLLWATAAVASLTLVLPYLAPVAALFGFVPLPWQVLLASLLIVAGYIVATEGVKARFYRALPRA